MFREMYKQGVKPKEALQEERRQKLLDEQKHRRLALQDGQRELQLTTNSNNDRQSSKQRSNLKHSTNSSGSQLIKDIYGCDYTLQLSEWLRERPAQLDDWFLVPCPKGQRCLLLACSGRTAMYSKAGKRCMTFHTLLPGDGGSGGGTSLLDCIYVPAQDTFYVLDALVYGNQELVHCEAQFRFFWLQSRFSEQETQLSESSASNEKSLQLLEHYDFENADQIKTALLRFPLWPGNVPALDGFLFYHKEASYTCGTTPLVGWLFAFMVPDVLDMRVNDEYVRPMDYTEPLSYMDAFDAQWAKKKQRYTRIKQEKMDTSTSTVTDVEEMDDDAALKALLEAECKLELSEPVCRSLSIEGGCV